MLLRKYEKAGILQKYFVASDQSFMIYRVADWSIMAVFTRPITDTDSDGDPVNPRHMAWHIDLAFAQRIVENPAVFVATMVSRQTAREPDLLLYESTLPQLLQFQADVRRGAVASRIDPALEAFMKRKYIEQNRHLVDTYGNPPVFSTKKLSVALWLCLPYPFGFYLMYVGQWLLGLTMLPTIIAAPFFPPALPFAIAYHVIVMFWFFFRTLAGKTRDRLNRPVLSQKTKDNITATISRMAQYRNDLEGGRQ